MLILVLVFFDRVSQAESSIERVAITNKVNQLNAALTITMLEYMTQGRLAELANYHHANPYRVLADKMVLSDYQGEVDRAALMIKAGWYFNTKTREFFYRSAYQNEFSGYLMEFRYRDDNNSGAFESGQDAFESFRLIPSPAIK